MQEREYQGGLADPPSPDEGYDRMPVVEECFSGVRLKEWSDVSVGKRGHVGQGFTDHFKSCRAGSMT